MFNWRLYLITSRPLLPKGHKATLTSASGRNIRFSSLHSDPWTSSPPETFFINTNTSAWLFGDSAVFIYSYIYLFNFLWAVLLRYTHARAHTHTHTHTYIYIYIYIYHQVRLTTWNPQNFSLSLSFSLFLYQSLSSIALSRSSKLNPVST